MFVCFATDAVNETTTKIHVTRLIDDWSKFIYVKGKHSLPRGCKFDVTLTTKRTAALSKKRYWVGKNLSPVLDRAFVVALWKSKLPAWRAETIMRTFDRSNPAFAKTTGENYAYVWCKYARGLDSPESVSLAAEHVRKVLLPFYAATFKAHFTTHLVTGLGVQAEAADTLATHLDFDKTTDLDADVLAECWVARPYSPYLQGLDARDRNKLYSGDGHVRTRYEAHLAVAGTEMCGSTYVRGTYSDGELGILAVDDEYEPLEMCDVERVRDPTLSVYRREFLQHRDVADAEVWIAKFMVEYASSKPVVGACPTEAGSDFGHEQLEALRRVFSSRVSCVTGGPGTGKTWLSQRVCDAWARNVGGRVVVVSSYHQPLKNLEKGLRGTEYRSPSEFRTIASCHQGFLCGCSAESSLVHRPALLLVEEAGVSVMTDLQKVLECGWCARYPPHVLLVGDDRQLKPIGAGQPFADIVRLFPDLTTRLVSNRRTAASSIRDNTDAVDRGLPDLVEDAQFTWIKDAGELTNANYARVADAFFKKCFDGFSLATDVVVVHTNETRSLFNRLLHDRHLCVLRDTKRIDQRAFSCARNAAPGSLKRFVRGSRVICKKTSKDKTVTNGTRGCVHRDLVSDSLAVVVDGGTRVTYSDADIWELAYCLTVHKAQGSEYPCVVVYTYSDWHVARDWVYTAISRARNRVVYVVPPRHHVEVVTSRPVRESKSLLEHKIHSNRSTS